MKAILNVFPIVIMAVVLLLLIRYKKDIIFKGKKYHAKIMTFMLIVLVFCDCSNTNPYKRMLIIYFIILISKAYGNLKMGTYEK
jgi:hypothetical protein